MQSPSIPKIKLDKRLELTHGEKLCLKLRSNLLLKKKGYIVSLLRTNTHTQVDLRFGAKPLV